MRPRGLFVEIVVHGRGRGHSSEAKPIADALVARGDEVRVVAGGDAIDALDGVADLVRVDTFGPGPSLARRFVSRVRGDRDRLRASRPDVLVTHGDSPSMHAAKRLGVPVVAVGHGLVFSHGRIGVPLARVGRAREAVNALSSSYLADARVAVHFAPLRVRGARTVVAHVPPSISPPRAVPSDFLVAYFRDGGGDAWLDALAARGERVVLFGRRRALPRGIERREPSTTAFAAALSEAKGVVATSGASLLAEISHLGIPILALHARGDFEQEANARIAEVEQRGFRGPLDAFDPSVAKRFHARTREALELGRRAPARLPGPSVVEAVLAAIDASVEPRLSRHRTASA